MNKAKVLNHLETTLKSYGFSTCLENNRIFLKTSSGKGSLTIDYIENSPVVEFVYKDKFKESLDGDFEKERFAGANAFSKYSKAMCFFCYTPPNVYSFTSRMFGNIGMDMKSIENTVRFMACACIEGYAFLDAAGYYKNPKKRIVLHRELQENLHSMLPCENPGNLATI